MREARFKKNGKPVICGKECGKIWVYRGKAKNDERITCPGCGAHLYLDEALLPTGR